MPKINQYTDNSTIEDTDAMLTYDPSNGGSTKLTTFARIWTWITTKLAALTKKTSIASTDQILMTSGTAAARIDYNVLAKAIIEQYKSSTLAGSAQSIQEAFAALNSKWQAEVSTIEEFNTILLNLPSKSRCSVFLNGTVTMALISKNASSLVYVSKMDNVTCDMFLYSLGGNYAGIFRYNTQTSSITKQIDLTS